MLLTPPFVSPDQLDAALRTSGQAVVRPEGLSALMASPLDDLMPLQFSWDDLPPDGHLRDGGRYRRRRHACFIVNPEGVEPVPHRPHWQPLAYNALHGGLERWFEPIDPNVMSRPVWVRLLRSLADTCSRVTEPRIWYVEAHQFRIDTTDGIGRPTPEGAHRDGVDYVAVLLVARVGIKGGETRVFEASSPSGTRFTLTAPWTLLMLDDARVIHETTPIQPIDGGGHRDTLVLTFRRGGFQGP